MNAKPTILTGAIIGFLLTAALTAIFFLAAQLIGTPFVPFDMFDWIGRLLPGPVITFGIDLIVSVISALNISGLSSAAKTAEQIMAVGGVLATGTIAGAIMCAVLRRRNFSSRYLPGFLTGLIVGVPVMLISTSINRSAPLNDVPGGMLISAVWILLGFIVWGLLLGWVYNRLVTPASELSTSTSTVQAIDRRRFLITIGGASAAITVAGAGLSALLGQNKPAETALTTDENGIPRAWSALNALPNADDALQAAPGTRPEFTPLEDHYRIDINTLPPVVREEEWRLKISGLVDNPTELTLASLRDNYEPMHQFVTLACISNRIAGELIGTTRWTGVSLQKILTEVNPKPNATHLRITAADGFDEIVAIDTIINDERVMLTYAWDGLPLEVKHGFPLRIYIPNHYGMKQPKWITEIEFVEGWQEGYWVRRGWDKDALMKATSVIDTIAVDMMIVEADNTMKVPIGGIAHAGSREISRVEIRVDDGEWTEAQLRKPLSETTWVIWRYDWPFEPGEHTFYVRCFEGDGTPQIETVASPRPSGATGLHSIKETL
jgi:DMSO/TMAO reductase YedYZ molybdopterin-dependent catalytic subunit